MSTPRTGLGILLAALLAGPTGCGTGVPPDEARAKYPDEDYSTPQKWREVAEKYYPPAYEDYFEDMDAVGTTDGTGTKKLELSPAAIKGRNAWVLWAAGNDAWWDWVARYGYGTIDLLKLIDHADRETRFARTGLINEPDTREPSGPETTDDHGVRFARPNTDATRGKVHVEYRAGRTPADRRIYGRPSGVVGLRIFENPDFDEAAKARWNPDLYYDDKSEAGRKYAADPNTVRPFRVGMSCGFCHIAPHPLNPPADREAPDWANLSNNIGNQFMRIRAVFGNVLRPDNYLYHVFDSQLPGAVDTSGYPSDNNNNPNTINSFFGLPGRLARARHNPKETIGPESLAYLRTYVDKDFGNPHHVPRVLLDGSDSVGVHIALSRVYLNIGTHHQQWIRVQNPILGFRPQKPFALRDIAENSLSWHATLIRIDPMAAFFTASTDPMRLKDAPLTADQRRDHLRGTGLPWFTDPEPKKEAGKADAPAPGRPTDYKTGRQAFAKACAACHSSVQPGDLPELEAKLTADGLAAGKDGMLSDQGLAARRALRLTDDDRARLARGDGGLPAGYLRWAREAVEHREFWEHTAKINDRTVTVHNFLSIDERIPVTVARTNSARAVATNALHGKVWEDFASQTYKELGPVGPIRYRDPFSGAQKTYTPPGGGPGYYRVPTLISVWATAPFLHNNALGTFNNDPSVGGRLAAFDDAIDRLLWPDRRVVPSEQVYWEGEKPAYTMKDAWYPGKAGSTGSATDLAAAQRDADDGWIWRTTHESSVEFQGPHVPQLLGGLAGLSPGQMTFAAWAPALAFLLLGVLLLLRDRIARRLSRWFSGLGWLTDPFVRLLQVIGWILAIFALIIIVFKGYEYWGVIAFLDGVTENSIWGFRALAVVAPVILFVATFVLFAAHRFPGAYARRAPLVAGAVCLLVALALALGLGRFLSGRGAGVRIGPIPEGVPVNVLANFNPDAPFDAKLAAARALMAFIQSHPADAAERKAEFDARVAPALMNVSKCPDFVTDRGHDYESIRRLTDEEKRELVALLKTF